MNNTKNLAQSLILFTNICSFLHTKYICFSPQRRKIQKSSHDVRMEVSDFFVVFSKLGLSVISLSQRHINRKRLFFHPQVPNSMIEQRENNHNKYSFSEREIMEGQSNSEITLDRCFKKSPPWKTGYTFLIRSLFCPQRIISQSGFFFLDLGCAH